MFPFFQSKGDSDDHLKSESEELGYDFRHTEVKAELPCVSAATGGPNTRQSSDQKQDSRFPVGLSGDRTERRLTCSGGAQGLLGEGHKAGFYTCDLAS